MTEELKEHEDNCYADSKVVTPVRSISPLGQNNTVPTHMRDKSMQSLIDINKQDDDFPLSRKIKAGRGKKDAKDVRLWG